MIDSLRNYIISIENSNFSNKDQECYFRGSTQLEFTGEELYDAVITCGMPSFYLTENSTKKRSIEIMYKLFLLNTILDADSCGNLMFSNKINYLDSTEKAYLMYYVGMFITKLISQKIFGFDYLVHLGIVKQYKSMVFDTNKQPDLIAFNRLNNNYSVFEAKGRTRIDNRMFIKAKSQVSAIKWISGSRPLNGIVSVVYRHDNKVKCHLKDPDIIGGKEFDISKLELIWLYYEPIFSALKEIQNDECNFNNNYISKIINFDKNKQVKIEMNLDLYEFFDKFEENKEKKDSEKNLICILENKKAFNFEIVQLNN